ncbi:MAG: response regulator [Bradyrhizobiaceae bacterium]|nr:MAG: response regulator [Bradyrhizobiaceae bacterium]
MTSSFRNAEADFSRESDIEEFAEARTTGGAAVVLVVEDDPLLRMNAVDMIEDAGFEALEAPDADVAISVLEARTDIRLIFTDIDMPGSMDGLALAHAVANRWPPVRIIATSGHFKVSETDLPTGGKFIPKPYRQHQLVDVLSGLSAST